MRDAELDGAVHAIQQARLTHLVTLDSGQAAFFCPTTIAIHHDRHVVGYEFCRQVGWRRPRWVRWSVASVVWSLEVPSPHPHR